MPDAPPLRLLATDLDGTLIPLDGRDENVRDLRTLESLLESRGIELLFVTGRDHGLAVEALERHGLPRPAAMICDVGARLLERGKGGGLVASPRYAETLAAITGGRDAGDADAAAGADARLTRQEESKQARFKLSYYCPAEAVSDVAGGVEARLADAGLAFAVIASVDPFDGRGLIDVLPAGVNKAFAIDAYVTANGLPREAVAFAGDSGNDLAALTAGYHAIVVGNARAEVVAEARRRHAAEGRGGSLHVADAHATSGVLEGVRRLLG